MLKKTSLVLTFVCLFFVQWLKGLYGGFAHGASKMCDFHYPSYKSETISFWISHADPYFYLTNYHTYLALTLLIFTIVKLIEKGIISQLLSFLPLAVCLFFLFSIFGQLEPVLQDSDPYIDLLRDTVNYVRMMLSIVIILLFLQVIAASKSLYEKYKNN